MDGGVGQQVAGLAGGRLAYNVVEVASLLRVSVGKVRELVRAGVLPHKRLGRRIVIPAVLLAEWLNSAEDWSSSGAGAGG